MQSAHNSDLKGLERHLRTGLARTQVKPDSHPDPDLLAAFAEHTLPRREKDLIFEHLAVCDLCREVVALSAPEPETEIAPLPVRKAGKWSALFAQWSWVPAAACAAVLLAAVGIGIVKKTSEHEAASKSALSNLPQQTQASNTEPNVPGTPANELARTKTENIPAVPNPGGNTLRERDSKSNKSGESLGNQIATDQPASGNGNNYYITSGTIADNRLDSSAGQTALSKDKTAGGGRAADDLARGYIASSTTTTTTAVQANNASAPVVSAELSDHFARLPHDGENKSLKVQSVQQQGPASVQVHAPPLDEDNQRIVATSKRSEKEKKADQDTNGYTLIASAPKATPNLAFASGTPLWEIQNGQLVQKQSQAEQTARAQSSVTLTQNATNLPANIVPVKIAQLGTTLFVVAQSGALLVSKDNGGAWQNIAGPWQGQVRNVTLLGTVAQIETSANETWSSSDQGATWQPVQTMR